MKTNWTLYLILGLSIFCLMGISNSQQAKLSMKVPYEAFKLPSGIPSWDWETDDTKNLGSVRIRNWDEVMRMAEENTDAKHEYQIDIKEFETILLNNIFLFTRVGLTQDFSPSVWDIDFSTGYRRYLYQPDAFTLAKILTDSKQDAAREAFVNAAIRIVKDPKTKASWEAQRQRFTQEMIDIWEVEPGHWAWQDYQRMKNIDYDSSITMAFNEILKQMKNVDFALKVIPDGWNWRIVRVINTYFETVLDDSPFKLQSACFRMGPEATEKLMSYIERGRDSLK